MKKISFLHLIGILLFKILRFIGIEDVSQYQRFSCVECKKFFQSTSQLIDELMGQIHSKFWVYRAHVFLVNHLSLHSPLARLRLLLSPYPLHPAHLTFPKLEMAASHWTRPTLGQPPPPPAAAALAHGRRNGRGRRRIRVPLLLLRPPPPPPPPGQARDAPRRPGGTGRAVRAERQAEEAAARRARAPRAALHVRGRRALRPRTTPSLPCPKTMCTLTVSHRWLHINVVLGIVHPICSCFTDGILIHLIRGLYEHE